MKSRGQPNMHDVFRALGQLEATAKSISDRQTEEIANSAAHRQRVYDRLEVMDGKLEKNAVAVEDMMPVFKRAQEAEQQRKVYKWQGRVVFTLIGGAIAAFVSWLLRQA